MRPAARFTLDKATIASGRVKHILDRATLVANAEMPFILNKRCPRKTPGAVEDLPTAAH